MSTPTTSGPQQGWGPDPATPPAPGPTPARLGRWESLKTPVRLIGTAVIAVLAVLSFVVLTPAQTSGHSLDRVVIWADDDTNQQHTQGAPQQAVVNGWTGNALLDLISEQLDQQAAPDDRPAALLTLGVLLLALGLVTAPKPR